jgi:hypothetical protein
MGSLVIWYITCLSWHVHCSLSAQQLQRAWQYTSHHQRNPAHLTGWRFNTGAVWYSRPAASVHGELYFLDELVSAAASVASHDVELARQWHRRLGHLGYSTLAGLTRRGLLSGCSTSQAAFMQASKQQVCQPCTEGKLQRGSHPTRHPRLVRVLHRLHMDLCELRPGLYFATVVDEATRYACVGLLHHKSDTAAEVRKQITWCETQTDHRVQRVRHDCGGEHMSRQLQQYYQERGIQPEPTAGYSPEANGGRLR